MVAIAQKNRGRVIPADGPLWDPALLGSALIYTSGSARASDENSPCRMVKAARDAWLSGALTQHSNRLSLPRPSSPSGKRNFPGQRQRPETLPANQSADCRDKMRAQIAASSGRFALNREIPVCAGLRGGAGRTRTSNQTIISRQL